MDYMVMAWTREGRRLSSTPLYGDLENFFFIQRRNSAPGLGFIGDMLGRELQAYSRFCNDMGEVPFVFIGLSPDVEVLTFSSIHNGRPSEGAFWHDVISEPQIDRAVVERPFPMYFVEDEAWARMPTRERQEKERLDRLVCVLLPDWKIVSLPHGDPGWSCPPDLRRGQFVEAAQTLEEEFWTRTETTEAR